MLWVIAFLVAHEAGHAIVSQACGNPCRGVRLGVGPCLLACNVRGFRLIIAAVPVGVGVIVQRWHRGHERMTALAGVVAGLGVALYALYIGLWGHQMLIGVVGLLCLAWSIIQLLPLPGFDGYHVFGKAAAMPDLRLAVFPVALLLLAAGLYLLWPAAGALFAVPTRATGPSVLGLALALTGLLLLLLGWEWQERPRHQ